MGRPKGSKNRPKAQAPSAGDHQTSQASQTSQDNQTNQATAREVDEDLDKGTATYRALVAHRPRTEAEIIALLGIDTSRYRLARYWNKEKGRNQHYRWEVSALVDRRRDAGVDRLEAEQVLARIFSSGKRIRPITFQPQPSNHKALFLYLSDKHVGSFVDPVRSVYANHYGPEVYEARMVRTLEEAMALRESLGVFEDVFILDLGDRMDGLDGMTTRKGHKLPQNVSNRVAYDTAVRVEKVFLDRLFAAGVGNNYHLVQNCNSNHGGDFDYMVARSIELYVQQAYPQVTTRLLEKFIEHLDYGVHTLLLTHGKDDEDMKHGLPFHLNDKTEGYLLKYLVEHGIDPKRRRVSLVKGDLHRDASEVASHLRYRNAMSMFGGSKWIATNFGPTRPGCSYDIIDRDSPRILEGRILF